MKKKIAIVLGICIVFIVVYFVYASRHRTVISTELSERSKAYLEESKAKRGDTSLKYAETEAQSDIVSRDSVVTVGDCFEFITPFRISNERQMEDKCHVYLSTVNPKGTIIAYQYFGSTFSSFDDVPGVSLRRSTPQEYTEESISAGGKTFLGFGKKSGKVEKNYFYFTPNSYMVVNFDLSTTEEEAALQIEALLASLTLLK